MAKRILGEGPLLASVQQVCRDFGMDPNYVRAVTIRLEQGDIPLVTFEVMAGGNLHGTLTDTVRAIDPRTVTTEVVAAPDAQA